MTIRDGIKEKERKRIKLAHVCQRWRSAVFQSPRRLDFRIVCTRYTSVRDTLDIWPPFPLFIWYLESNFDDEDEPSSLSRLDSIVAALEHDDRVCRIDLELLSGLQMGYVTHSAAMQKPFPGADRSAARNHDVWRRRSRANTSRFVLVRSSTTSDRVCNHFTCVTFRFQDYRNCSFVCDSPRQS